MADDETPRPDDTPPDDDAGPRRAAWFQYTDASSVGIEMVVAISVCTIGAYYLERHVTHWSPWTTLLGVLFGCLAAANAVVRAARSYQRSLRREREGEPRDRP